MVVRKLITQLGYEITNNSVLVRATENLVKYKKVLDAITKSEAKAEAQKAKPKAKVRNTSSKLYLPKNLALRAKQGEQILNKIRKNMVNSELLAQSKIRASTTKTGNHSKTTFTKIATDAQKKAQWTSRAFVNSNKQIVASNKRRVTSAVAGIRKQKAETLQLLRMYQSIGRSVHNMAVGLTYSIGLPFARFLGSAVSTSMEFERMNVGFSVLLGDMGKANALMGTMRGLARETSLNFQEIAKTGKILLGTGMGEDDIMKRINQLGDVTMGNNEVFGRVAWQYAQAVAKGRPQGDELRRFGEAGIPIYKALGEVLNTTQAGVVEMSKKGQLSIDDLNKALDHLTKKGGLFHGMMEKQLDTAGGQFMRLQSLVVDLKKVIGDDWAGAIKNVLKAINWVIEQVIKFPKIIRMGVVALGMLLALTGLIIVGLSGMVLAGLAFGTAMRTAMFYMKEMEASGVKIASMQMLGALTGGGLKGGKLGKLGKMGGTLGLAGAGGALATIGTALMVALPYIIAIGGLIALLAILFKKTKGNSQANTLGAKDFRRKNRAILDVNVNSKLEVPEGTTKQQEAYLISVVNKAQDDKFNKAVNGMIADTAGSS